MRHPVSSVRRPSGRALVPVFMLAIALAGCGGGAGASPSAVAVPSATTPAATGTASASPVTAAPVTPPPTAPPSPAPTPTPAPTVGADSPVLLAAGDIADCTSSDDDAVGALLAGIPGAIATLGDTAYPAGTAQQLRDCFGEAWGGVLDRIRFAVTGNHDVATDGGAPLREYLGTAAARDGRTYFSDQLGSWHVIVLDADCGEVAGGCGADSPQAAWLRADLAASDARCTVAMWHQPRFSSGWHGDDTSSAVFWDALYAGGADLVLNGHDHDYERFVPQDPSGAADDARGITEFVVGTGGGEARGFGGIEANSAAHASGVFGVLELRLGEGAWASQFVGSASGFTDESAGTCH